MKLIKNLAEGEHIIKVVRRDNFVFLKRLFFFALSFILPIVFYVVFLSKLEITTNEWFIAALVLFASIYFMFNWLFLFVAFLDFYFDVWVITNERLVNIVLSGFFSRRVSEQSLEHIEDVTSDIHGVMQTILDYGNVNVQTASENGMFIFSEVPQPEEIRSLIISLVENHERQVRPVQMEPKKPVY